MLMLSSLLLATILLIRLAPDLPLARLLSEHLVKRPLLWLHKRERHDFLYFVIVTAMFLAGGEIIVIIGPDLLILYAADLALYLDALLFTYWAVVAVNVKIAVGAVRTRLSSWYSGVYRLFGAASRERSSRKRTTASRADNDDEDGSTLLRIAA